MNIDNTVLSINRRLQNIAKNVGTEHQLYQEYNTKIKRMFTPESIVTRNGVTQIKRGNVLKKESNVGLKLSRLKNLESYKDIANKSRKQLKEQGINKPTKEQINKQARLSNNAEKIINENAYKYSEYDTEELQEVEKILTKTGTRKTWDEIRKAVEVLSKDYKGSPIKSPKNEFLGLKGVNR